MTTKQIIIATITGTIVLFLFDGAFQAIPILELEQWNVWKQMTLRQLNLLN